MVNYLTAYKYYSPFGMVTPGRSFSAADGYRFGFNGKESDAETYGSGNIYDYGFRIYDPRLGKFLSVDPISKDFAWYAPYQFAGNKPIAFIDLDGLEDVYFGNEKIESGNEEPLTELLYTSLSFQTELNEFKNPESNKGYDIIIVESEELVENKQGLPTEGQTHAVFSNDQLLEPAFAEGDYGKTLDQGTVSEIASKGRGLIIIALPIGTFSNSRRDAEVGSWYEATMRARTLGHEFKHAFSAAKLGMFSDQLGEQQHADWNFDPDSKYDAWPAGQRSPNHHETMAYYPNSSLGRLYSEITKTGTLWSERKYEYISPIKPVKPSLIGSSQTEPTIKAKSQ